MDRTTTSTIREIRKGLGQTGKKTSKETLKKLRNKRRFLTGTPSPLIIAIIPKNRTRQQKPSGLKYLQEKMMTHMNS